MAIFGLDKYGLNLISVDLKDPYKVFRSLYNNYKNVFILESLTGPKEMAEFSIIGFDPIIKFTADKDDIKIKHRDGSKDHYKADEPLQILKEIMPKINDYRFRYIGGAVGYICYDAINYWEDIRVKSSDYSTMEFGIYTDGLLFDHINLKTYYFFIDKPRFDDIKFEDKDGYLSINKIERNTSIDEFKDMIIKAKNYIYDGDIYQVVLSKRFNLEIKGDRLPIYANLRKINPSPYMYMLKMDNKEIIGSSPEMLVRTVKDKVETFPIAGTRPISRNREKNEELKQELLNDEKELAEHTMLVDLARNDLGRVCKWGSVKVDELMSIKEFSHVQHIVSHVTGILDNKDCYDALRAVFPAGTVSGAPKVRAMEIIDELEKDPRGPYAGALGYFSFNGSSDFAITIRSLFINGNDAYVQSGAGIVADSDPEKEWYETEHKAQAVLDAIKRCIEC
ncbi:MAG: anthranilate synthase component I [Candidatus Nitrosocaldaceae archaeon]|nr:MAG: anthranilate synthase component I [Candidatus Nitrosocaldaceae archaeon]